jgi:hypothetical protein
MGPETIIWMRSCLCVCTLGKIPQKEPVRTQKLTSTPTAAGPMERRNSHISSGDKRQESPLGLHLIISEAKCRAQEAESI